MGEINNETFRDNWVLHWMPSFYGALSPCENSRVATIAIVNTSR